MTADATAATATAKANHRSPLMIASRPTIATTTIEVTASQRKNATAIGARVGKVLAAVAVSPNFPSPAASSQCIRPIAATTASEPETCGQKPGRVRNGTITGRNVMPRNTSKPRTKKMKIRGSSTDLRKP